MAKPYTFDPNKKHSLGHRAFLLFFSRRFLIFAIPFALAFAAWYAERWIPIDYAIWGMYATELLFMASIAIFLVVLMRTYFEYRYYTYLFTDDAFIMTYGYLVRNEIATLYHQIQNVNIQRSMMDRAVGVSQIIILMAGSDRDARRNQVVLPAVGNRKARLVQAELLRRARRYGSSSQSEVA